MIHVGNSKEDPLLHGFKDNPSYTKLKKQVCDIVWGPRS